jgi:putative tryptophan/tyrosine transport system substrate-binding protein
MLMLRLSRRAFVGKLVALAASAVFVSRPRSSYAQRSTTPPRIGVLTITPSEETDVQMFRQGLREAGYVEGRNVVIEWRSANGDYARIPELIANLVEHNVDVIVVETTVAAKALVRTTSTIPIVMAVVGDPVRSGLATSLAHPGGNVTGHTMMAAELGAKRLQLLKEAVADVARIAVLWNPDTPFHPQANADLKAAAPALSLKLNFVTARTPDEFGPAFAEMSRARAQALYVSDDATFTIHRTTLVNLASKARLPASYSEKLFVHEGGLMSYGPNLGDLYRRSAGFVDKILNGAKPNDLPIEQPIEFELAVNLKTANELGVKIPETIRLLANELVS